MQRFRAISRLLLILNRFLLTGLDTILFDNKEIVNYSFEFNDFPADKEKQAFVERLNKNK